jgi:hypothetical protein
MSPSAIAWYGLADLDQLDRQVLGLGSPSAPAASSGAADSTAPTATRTVAVRGSGSAAARLRSGPACGRC